MTTLSEYKAMMEGATDAPWSSCGMTVYDENEELFCAHSDRNAHFIAGSRNIAPSLIRVIELAEEALEDAEGYSFGNATQQEHEARRYALSEIRKLKGE